MLDYFLIALAVASISITIGKSHIFLSLRKLLPGKWLKELFNCLYCLADWLSLTAVLYLNEYTSLFDLLIKTMAVVTVSSFFAWFIYDYLLHLEKQ